MNTRILLNAFVVIALATSPAFSAAPPDSEATKMLVGSWVAPREQYNEGLSSHGGFTFKRDGTFSSYGIFVRGDQKIRIDVKGKWSIKNGVLIEELTSSSRPELAPKGLVTRDTLLAVTDKEYRFRTEHGLTYSYSRQ